MADKDTKSGDTVSVSKDMFYGIIIVVLAGLLVLSVLTQGFWLIKSPAPVVQPTQPTAPTAPTQPSAPTQPTQPTQPAAPGTLEVTVGDYPPEGQVSAPVTWVMFSDFECPFCSKIFTDAEPQIKTNYIDTGKVKFYYRDFPLTSIHPDAMAGALAARCANDQGAFWKMHDMLFTDQATWSVLPDPTATLEGYAVSLGLNNATFSTCLTNQTHIAQVNADESVGAGYGVQGTPSNFLVIPKAKATQSDLQTAVNSLNSQYGQGVTLFVNSDNYVVEIPGAYPYAAFDAVLSKVSY